MVFIRPAGSLVSIDQDQNSPVSESAAERRRWDGGGGAFGSATGTINVHSIVSTNLDELMNLQRSLAETTPEAKKTSNTP